MPVRIAIIPPIRLIGDEPMHATVSWYAGTGSLATISYLIPATGVDGGHESSPHDAVWHLRRESLHLIENPELLFGRASDDSGH